MNYITCDPSIKVAIISNTMAFMDAYHLFSEIFLRGSELHYDHWWVVPHIASSSGTLCMNIGRNTIVTEIPYYATIRICPHFISLEWDNFILSHIENNAYNMNLLRKWKTNYQRKNT